jgi:peptide-methionine (S)-S-oxide reductase
MSGVDGGLLMEAAGVSCAGIERRTASHRRSIRIPGAGAGVENVPERGILQVMRNTARIALALVAISTLAGGPMNDESRLETATFGGGCFWCVEAVFQRLDGVISVRSGFMGGRVPNPDYRAVCRGDTGHAEVVQIRFDPARIGYDDLLDWFWRAHDPTQMNRQGGDVGTPYRSVIFYHSDDQKRAAERSKAARQQDDPAVPVLTEIAPASVFFQAENYHQDYYNRNPGAGYCRLIIAPKLKKLKIEK